MTFNNNLNNYSGRGSSGGGGPQRGGMGGGGLGSLLFSLLASRLGRRVGIPGIAIVGAIYLFTNGGFANLIGGSSQQGALQRGGDSLEHCQTAEDANSNDDCRVLATAVSLDQVWSEMLPEAQGIDYKEPGLTLVSGSASTACGAANITQTGPFYCPGDETVYMSVPFFDEIRKMGGSDGPFAQIYVTAHEFGHHVQNLMNTLGNSNYDDPGADSGAVQVELQADCYAGLWASRADKGEDALLEPITEEQVGQAIATARAIGDDAIQESSGAQVNPDQWTHGSSEQRQEWFMRGYQGGTMTSCNQPFNS